MNYIVADELLIPESHQKFYSEKLYICRHFLVTNAFEGKKFVNRLGLPPDNLSIVV